MEEYTEEDIRKVWEEGQRKLRLQAKPYWQNDSIKVRLPRTWEFMRSTNLEEIVKVATEMGWADNAVQIKRYQINAETTEYYIEPYENCDCPSILKYEDYAPNRAKIDE